MSSQYAIGRVGPTLYGIILFVACLTTPSTSLSMQLASVEATGSGRSREEALRHAYAQAVQSAIGLLVDATVVIENDQIITDQVLTLSSGYIKTSRVVHEEEEHGLTHVRIHADVKRGPLLARLQELNVSGERNVDGASLAAEALTKGTVTQDAREMLRKVLGEFPAGCLVAQVGHPQIGEQDGSGSALFRVPVRVTTDPAAYKVFDARLRRVLDEIALSKRQFTLRAIDLLTDSASEMPHHWRTWRSGFAYPRGVALFSMPAEVSIFELLFNRRLGHSLDLRDVKSFAVVLFDSHSDGPSHTKWTAYFVDLKYRDLFAEVLIRPASVITVLQDSDGTQITRRERGGALLRSAQAAPSQRSPSEGAVHLLGVGVNAEKRTLVSTWLTNASAILLESYNRIGDDIRVYTFSPYFYYCLHRNGVGAFSPEVRFVESFRLRLSEVGRVKNVQCFLRNPQ